MNYPKGTRVVSIVPPYREGTVVGYRTATGFVKVLWDGRISPQRLSIYEVKPKEHKVG